MITNSINSFHPVAVLKLFGNNKFATSGEKDLVKNLAIISLDILNIVPKNDINDKMGTIDKTIKNARCPGNTAISGF